MIFCKTTLNYINFILNDTDSYQKALQAEDILVNKTDLETSDYEKIEQDLENISPNFVHKKRKFISYNEEKESSSDDDFLPDPPKCSEITCETEFDSDLASSCVRQNAFIISTQEDASVASNNEISTSAAINTLCY